MDILKYGAKPEEYGLNSQDIAEFITEVENRGYIMHSVMIIADSNVIAEGYYPPFDEKFFHRMYSTSKTFVSAAVGALADEGKISLDDSVAKYFPEQENVHPLVEDATLRDLLMMSSPFIGTTYVKNGVPNAVNWVDTFFTEKPLRPAGTTFDYDTAATYILDVIVEKITGKSFLEYLKDKFLCDIGFSRDSYCIKAPEGYAWGGSGIMCTTRDLGRFAQVFMNQGEACGKQVISREYMKAATTKQTSNIESGWHDVAHGNGYGYQVWITKKGWAFLGMGGQFAFFYPEKKLILISTGDNQGHGCGYVGIAQAFEDIVLRNSSDMALPESKEGYRALENKLATLSILPLEGEKHLPLENKCFNKKYTLEENPMGIKWIKLTTDGKLVYENATGVKEYEFGFGEYKETLFPETHYFDDTISIPSNRKYSAIACGAWVHDNKFAIRTFITDKYFGNFTATFGFKDNRVGVKMIKTAEWFLNEYQGLAWGSTNE